MLGALISCCPAVPQPLEEENNFEIFGPWGVKLSRVWIFCPSTAVWHGSNLLQVVCWMNSCRGGIYSEPQSRQHQQLVAGFLIPRVLADGCLAMGSWKAMRGWRQHSHFFCVLLVLVESAISFLLSFTIGQIKETKRDNSWEILITSEVTHARRHPRDLKSIWLGKDVGRGMTCESHSDNLKSVVSWRNTVTGRVENNKLLTLEFIVCSVRFPAFPFTQLTRELNVSQFPTFEKIELQV